MEDVIYFHLLRVKSTPCQRLSVNTAINWERLRATGLATEGAQSRMLCMLACDD